MLKITGQNIEVTDSITEMLESKFQKINNRFDITKVNFSFSLVANNVFKCHAELISPEYGTISATHSEPDFHHSSNQVFAKLERQLKDAKNRKSNKGGKTIAKKLEEISINEDEVEPDTLEA